MLNFKEELLPILKECAYRKGEYTLSSGRKSEHYVNCKPVTLSSRGLILSRVLLMEHKHEDSGAVGGLTLGADPLVCGVTVVAATEGIKLDGLIVRKEAKGHGTGAYIEGPTLKEGANVTVLEDVITTGGSAIQAVQRLRDAGYVVNRVAAIVDRQEDGEADAAMKEADLELVSIFKLDDICE